MSVKALVALASQQTRLEHFRQHFRGAEPGTEMGGDGFGDMIGDIDADFIDESQWPHGHAKIEHRFVYVFYARAAFKEMPSFDQVRHENAVDEETGAVFDHHRQLPNLLHETNRTLQHFRGGLLSHDHFHQLHAVNGVEKVNANHALRMPGG